MLRKALAESDAQTCAEELAHGTWANTLTQQPGVESRANFYKDTCGVIPSESIRLVPVLDSNVLTFALIPELCKWDRRMRFCDLEARAHVKPVLTC